MGEVWRENRSASRYEAVKERCLPGLVGGARVPHVRRAVAERESTGRRWCWWRCRRRRRRACGFAWRGRRPASGPRLHVVSREEISTGGVRLRLEFVESCPYTMFEVAVLGRDTAE